MYKVLFQRELPLRKGDIVYLLRQIDRNWFKGERHGTVGIFPVNYVEVSEVSEYREHNVSLFDTTYYCLPSVESLAYFWLLLHIS